jgi:hypothetical protein
MTWSDTFLGLLRDDGVYQITDRQQAATGGVTDIVAVTRGAPALPRANGYATKPISKNCSIAASMRVDRFYWR